MGRRYTFHSRGHTHKRIQNFLDKQFIECFFKYYLRITVISFTRLFLLFLHFLVDNVGIGKPVQTRRCSKNICPTIRKLFICLLGTSVLTLYKQGSVYSVFRYAGDICDALKYNILEI